MNPTELIESKFRYNIKTIVNNFGGLMTFLNFIFQKLPSINKEFALKLINDEREGKKSKTTSSLLKDDRFKALFENPDFQVDPNAEEYK